MGKVKCVGVTPEFLNSRPLNSRVGVTPEFPVELRFDDGVVCIYGTARGLRRIAEFCNRLVEDPNQGHIHLEDQRILTDRSEKGAIAIFAPAD